MRIHFFEEYPTDECLSLAQQLDAPATVFLAAQDPQAFAEAAARLRRWNPALKAAYWPLLPRSYWISPFAYTDEIQQIRRDLEELRRRPGDFGVGDAREEGVWVLLDLELPLLQRRLFWQNAGSFRATKRAIEALLQDAEEPGLSLFSAEYPVPFHWMEWCLRQLGVSYPQARFAHTPIAMLYTSLAPRRRWAEWLGRRLLARKRHLAEGKRLFVGLGTIATGVFGNEPILSPDELAQDLALSRDYGVTDAVIFRLGGLTPAYLDVIRQFQDEK